MITDTDVANALAILSAYFTTTAMSNPPAACNKIINSVAKLNPEKGPRSAKALPSLAITEINAMAML